MFMKFVMRVAVVLAGGFSGVSFAQSNDCGMNQARVTILDDASISAAEIRFQEGKPSGMTVAGARFEFLRDAGTSEIVGYQTEQGQTVFLTKKAVNAVPPSPVSPAPAPRSRVNPIGAGSTEYLYCDNGGGGAYFSEVLPPVEITKERAPSVVFWQETIQSQIYVPNMPVTIDPSVPGLSPEYKRAKCFANTNFCVAAADTIGNGVYGICGNLATEAAKKRGPWWGVATVAAIGAACVAGIEAARSAAKDKCYNEHARCMTAAGG